MLAYCFSCLPADRVVLKTCGTTKLLSCVPFMVQLAAAHADMAPARVKYTRASFLFPEQQPAPHTSFEHECDALRSAFASLGSSSAYVLGDGLNGLQWHVFVAGEQAAAAAQAGAAGAGAVGGHGRGLAGQRAGWAGWLAGRGSSRRSSAAHRAHVPCLLPPGHAAAAHPCLPFPSASPPAPSPWPPQAPRTPTPLLSAPSTLWRSA
jgi:hypothetical protein